MSTPCGPCAGIDNQNVCGQTITVDNSTGDLFITPNGNSINLCEVVKFCETKTILQSVTLTGTVLQVQYLGEDGVPQYRNVDLAPLVADVPASFTTLNTTSIALNYVSGVLRGNLLVDPASLTPVSASSNGVYFGAAAQTPITVNNTNTIQLISSGTNGYTLTSNLKYVSSGSILLSDNTSGLTANLLYSSDAGNVANQGTDGKLYVQSASSQLSGFPTNGFAVTGSSGTKIVGSDSKLYTIPTPAAQSPIVGVTTESITLTTFSDGHTIQADVRTANSNSVNLTQTVGGVQANVNVGASGNVPITIGSDGLNASITCTTLNSVLSNTATVANPITKTYGKLNDGTCGYANVTVTPYGTKIPSFTTSQRTSITDLYDTLLVFDSTLRKFMWYDAVGAAWVQLG